MDAMEQVQEEGQKVEAGSPSEGLFLVASENTGGWMKTISFIAKFAAKFGLSERRKDERVSAPELLANYASSGKERRARVKDISPTGAYLLTHHRWLPGTDLVLTLQSHIRRQRNSAPQVRLHAKVVRTGRDGVGVSFFDEHADAAQWLSFVSKASTLFPTGGPIRVFQMARVLAFLIRFSPSAEDSITELFGSTLSGEGIERALEVVLRAEELRAGSGSAPRREMPPSLLIQILVHASKSNEEPMRQSWAGLLASSLSQDSNDEEYRSFAALLPLLESVHLLIVTAGGRRLREAGIQLGSEPCQELYCTMDEIKRMTQTRNVAVLECALNRLYDFGLLELTVRPFGCASLDRVNLTPTKLGFALCRACSGPQQDPETEGARQVRVAF